MSTGNFSPSQVEQLSIQRKKCEAAYENAIENIGMTIDSHLIWRDYINYVRNWNEINVGDSARKLNTLRRIYQQAIAIPMEQSDDVWNEYEIFEKKNGEEYAETVLPELSKKFLHAKSIFKERKRCCSCLVFDRLATPPTNSFAELQQIEFWNQWIK
jgi:cleavage stimulation factor subunit 3